MVLDEFAGLKRMEVIENAVAQIAGYGVKLFFVLQSLEQLKAVYKDNWETFLANSGLKVFFNLEDHFSREYVSKLIGETEVIREVRSASEGTSESESVSHSVSRSESETTGRSSSTGTSESEGTNSSVNKGRSGGVNFSQSRSTNYTYAQGFFFRKYDDEHISEGRSESWGHSKGWSEGSSQGVSHGTSRSRTDGTSESRTAGTSETEGTTRGTSQSRTAGTNETIQKRALITPDEIGQAFARIDERTQLGYPGLALVVISGARPVALVRVNYYEDFQFMGLFDPAPDYPFSGPKELTVDGRSGSIQKYLTYFDCYLTLGDWSIKSGEMVPAGEPALPVFNSSQAVIGHVRVPRTGMIGTVTEKPVREGPLFSVRYYEDGGAPVDPFADVIKYAEEFRSSLIRMKEKAKSEADRYFWPALGFVLVVAIVGGYVFGVTAVIVGLAGAGVCGWKVYGKAKEINTIVKTLKLYDGVDLFKYEREKLAQS